MVTASPVRPNPVSGPAGEGGAGPVTALLTTDRLALREFTAADAPLLTGLNAGPKVLRHLTGGRANPPEEIREPALPRSGLPSPAPR